MNITAKLLTVGRKPKPEFIGKKGTLKVSFPAAENHNKKVGNKWETVSTSWFNLEAWGDAAQRVMDELNEGDSFELISGIHKIDKVGDKYYSKYTIFEFEKYEKN